MLQRVAFTFLLGCSVSGFSAEPDFATDVYPLLQTACFECHGPERQEGGLRLDTKDSLLESEAVTAGQPGDSELLRRVLLPKGHEEAMPAIGDPLKPTDVDTLRRWIQNGAPWPDDFVPPKHWSYQPPVRPELPEASFPAERRPNAIDHFIAAQLQQRKLQPSAEASPETLIRRLSFDLIGLPPSPEAVNAFAANPTPEAYEALVDQLLAKPQFGERWARPWLDMARYADSHGFQRDNLREIWAYRDWVIQALNADMPFDQFSIEQIAGDLLPNATEQNRIATGFHRCTPTNVEAGSLPEETRIEQVIDRVNTTGTVWLGTTLECCQCHDHKYDPFSAKEYYQLLAYFNNTELEADRTDPKKPSSIAFKGPSMDLSDPEKTAKRNEIQAELNALKAKAADRTKQLQRSLAEWAAEANKQAKTPSQIHSLQPANFASLGKNDPAEILNDGSILLNGKTPPSKDTYTITYKTLPADTTAIRLDTLLHDSLPGKGPGRGDKVRNNFVLNRFEASVVAKDGTSRAVKFVRATADFAQQKYPAGSAINVENGAGWAIAPQFSKPHWAVFVLATPLSLQPGEQLQFRLVQNFGMARTIGRPMLSAITGPPDGETTPENIAKLLSQPAKKWTAKQRKTLLSWRSKQDQTLNEFAAEQKSLEKKRDAIKPDSTLVMIERPEPRDAYVFERGDYRSRGEDVSCGTPAVLHSAPAGPANRLALAKWLVDRDNPLVARVTVNRWWAEIFGRGLVATADDFGIKGERPTHPKLLDWLALEFMDNGWSMKQVLKTIVMSATYRQASVITPELAEQDFDNKWLARGSRFRMDAEMIRDNQLAIAGLLSDRQFGPSIRPPQPAGIWKKVGGTSYKYEVSPGEERYRRGIYVVLKRGAPYPSFINFDATARLGCTVKRSRTNTPLQALTLLNDPVYVEAAESLAGRLLDRDESDEARLVYAFQLCVARPPTDREQGILLDLLETQTSRQRSTKDANPTTARRTAWNHVASVILNLHETITKN